MDEQLKRRLIGASVLVALAVIFVPMLLEHDTTGSRTGRMPEIPPEPERRFDPALVAETPSSPAAPAAATSPAEAAAGTPEPSPPVAPGHAKKPKPAKAAHEPSRPEKKKRAREPQPPTGWVVQAASLRSREAAMKLVRRLRRAGLETLDPRPVKVKGQRFYRVLVGPELSRRNAERHLKLIQKITGNRGHVMRYP